MESAEQREQSIELGQTAKEDRGLFFVFRFDPHSRREKEQRKGGGCIEASEGNYLYLEEPGGPISMMLVGWPEQPNEKIGSFQLALKDMELKRATPPSPFQFSSALASPDFFAFPSPTVKLFFPAQTARIAIKAKLKSEK